MTLYKFTKIALTHNLGNDARPYYAVKGAEPHKKSLIH